MPWLYESSLVVRKCLPDLRSWPYTDNRHNYQSHTRHYLLLIPALHYPSQKTHKHNLHAVIIQSMPNILSYIYAAGRNQINIQEQ